MHVDGERAASGVGLVTLVIGVVLLLAPRQTGRLLRFGEREASLRVIGLADLALVPGLLRGRPRWPWMAARGALNVVIAGYCLRLARREGVVGAKVGAGAMVFLTLADGSVARRLRQRSER